MTREIFYLVCFILVLLLCVLSLSTGGHAQAVIFTSVAIAMFTCSTAAQPRIQQRVHFQWIHHYRLSMLSAE